MPAASATDLSALAEEQAALRRVATLVAQGTSANELFALVCQEVRSLFCAENAAIARFGPDGSDVVLVGNNGLIPTISIGTCVALEDVLVQTAVYRTGSPARRKYDKGVYDRFATEYKFGPGASSTVADSPLEMNFISSVAAPIVVAGSLWGVMTIDLLNRELPPDTEERVENFAELVATAIANAESRAELASSEAQASELAAEQAALRRVATLVARGVRPSEIFSAVSDEVGRLFRSEAAIARFEPDGSGMVVVGLTAGITVVSIGDCWELKDFLASTAVYRTGRPARYDHMDLQHASGAIADSLREMGIVSSVAAPIRVGGNLWGVVTASDTHKALPPGAEERLETFTELVATAIANAESHAELAASRMRAHELASEQAALRRVATLVAKGAPAEVVFASVAEEVGRLLGLEGIGVDRYESDGDSVVSVVVASLNDPMFPVGSRWPLDGPSLRARIYVTGRAARIEASPALGGTVATVAMKSGAQRAVGAPIIVNGAIWGNITAGTFGDEPIPDDVEERLAAFTELVSTAIANAESRAELDASRTRIVATADATRRRIERDLHDGIQQWLVTLALKASKAAAGATPSDPRSELSGIADDLVAVIDELREISRGIHPAILTDAGLDDALKALARRSPLRVVLDVNLEGRYEPTLEATVYYVVAESITNAVKHAEASVVSVRGGLRGERIELEIEDDGVGGADPGRGSGIIGLTDRVDSLGGTISISSPAGVGTTIRVTLPVSPRDEGEPLVGLPADAASIAPN